MSDSTIIAINVIEVAPDRQEELVTLLQEGGEHVFAPLPGFHSATVLASLDGSRVINIAEWESMDAVKAVQGNPEAAAFGPRVAAIATSTPGLYRTISTITPKA